MKFEKLTLRLFGNTALTVESDIFRRSLENNSEIDVQIEQNENKEDNYMFFHKMEVHLNY